MYSLLSVVRCHCTSAQNFGLNSRARLPKLLPGLRAVQLHPLSHLHHTPAACCLLPSATPRANSPHAALFFGETSTVSSPPPPATPLAIAFRSINLHIDRPSASTALLLQPLILLLCGMSVCLCVFNSIRAPPVTGVFGKIFTQLSAYNITLRPNTQHPPSTTPPPAAQHSQVQ